MATDSKIFMLDNFRIVERCVCCDGRALLSPLSPARNRLVPWYSYQVPTRESRKVRYECSYLSSYEFQLARGSRQLRSYSY
eukprot:scaffold531988_cov13-Prasinocladus_malaysianus.AAC.1